MRSARPVAAGAVLVALAATGCDSTIQKNDRARLDAQREIAGRVPTRVRTLNPDVAVTRVALVRDGRATAFVVELRSRAATPLTDVPISVGVRRDGREVFLNAGRNLGWFAAHVPAIPARGATTWVVRTTRPLKAGDVAFARVGIPGSRVRSSATALPRIEASPSGAAKRGARVVVRNASDVPQFDLQVYALARRGDRYIAAGAATVKQLDRDARAELTVPVTGRPGADVRVVAAPTIFR